MPFYYIIAIVIGAVICLAFALAAVCYAVAFGSRADKNPLLKYFTADDFGLSASGVGIKCGKNELRGYIYRNERVFSNGKTVVFVHGMGAGHIAYTTEISCFCNLGYAVLAVDSLGCNLSGGKRIRGMYQGVKTAVAAIDYACAELGGEIYLVGHSWGGYSALCASAMRKVDKAVAISAPSTPVKTLREGAAKFIGKPLAYLLCPFWFIINFLVFGSKGNMSAVKAAQKNGTPTLLIQGDADGIVTPVKSAFGGDYGDGVVKYAAVGKAHNPYNTLDAEKRLGELTAALARAGKMTKEEREKFFGGFDFKAATQEDEEVMNLIAEFLAN